MKCSSAKKLLIRKMEGVLDSGESAELAHHLKQCESCSEELQTLQIASEVFVAAKPPVPEPKADLWENIQAQILAEPQRTAKAPARPLPWQRWSLGFGTAAVAATLTLFAVFSSDLDWPYEQKSRGPQVMSSAPTEYSRALQAESKQQEDAAVADVPPVAQVARSDDHVTVNEQPSRTASAPPMTERFRSETPAASTPSEPADRRARIVEPETLASRGEESHLSYSYGAFGIADEESSVGDNLYDRLTVLPTEPASAESDTLGFKPEPMTIMGRVPPEHFYADGTSEIKTSVGLDRGMSAAITEERDAETVERWSRDLEMVYTAPDARAATILGY